MKTLNNLMLWAMLSGLTLGLGTLLAVTGSGDSEDFTLDNRDALSYGDSSDFKIDNRYVLQISSSGGGVVSAPGEGSSLHTGGTSVAIIASAQPDHHFVNWTGSAVAAGQVANSTAAGTTVIVDGDYTLQANFEQGAPPSADPISGLVAYYPFNGNAEDASGYGHHGMVHGATLVPNENGVEDSAYEFDGINDYIDCGSALPDMEEMTVSMCLFIPSPDRVACVFSDTENLSLKMDQDYQIKIVGKKNGQRLEHGFDLYDSLQSRNQFSITNRWIHMVWVMTQTHSTIYVDGVARRQYMEGGSNVGAHDLQVGCAYWRGPSQPSERYCWQGTISSMRFYNRSLTESEISTLYDACGTSDGPGGATPDPNDDSVVPSSTRVISVTTIAGMAQPGYSGDGGQATSALLNQPIDLATDSLGALYIADKGNSCVRRVGTDGVISTVADALPYLNSVAIAPLSLRGQPADTLYLFNDNRIYYLLPDGTLRRPGNRGWGYLTFDPQGNLFITDRHRVYKSGPDGSVGGQAIAGELATQTPRIWVNAEGQLYIADTLDQRILQVDQNGTLSVVAGNGSSLYVEGEAATQSGLRYPFSVTGDDMGRLFILDADVQEGTYVVRQVDSRGTMTTIAGGGSQSGDTHDALSARFEYRAYASTPSQHEPYESNLSYYDNALLVIDGDRIRKLSFAAGISVTWYVDDDAELDPAPYDLTLSDPGENGTIEHPYDSIQEAIEAAENGHEIIVRDGTYYETIDFLGKSIHVTGFDSNAEGRANQPCPIIDGHYQGTVVTFASGEDLDTRLSGFTITRGSGRSAGGILCLESHPSISNCLITGNRANTYYGGGAVYSSHSHARFENCTIAGNYGGGAGAGFYSENSQNVIENSILWDNLPADIWYPTSGAGAAPPTLAYTTLSTAEYGAGNITMAPQFSVPGYWAQASDPDTSADPANTEAIWIAGDYHLLQESPCIDAGDPNWNPDINRWDLNGQARRVNGRIDMGTYEYASAAHSLIAVYDDLVISLARDPNAVDPERTYRGQATLQLDAYFRSRLQVQATAVSDAGGTWHVTLSPEIIGPGLGIEVTLTVKGVDVDTSRLQATSEDTVLAKIELNGVLSQ